MLRYSCLETPIIDKFLKHIILYKRYIDNILLIWSGSSAELCRFRARLATANIKIKLEWQNSPGRIRQNSQEFIKVYHKPGTVFTYLPYGSYHARHGLQKWIKAALHRLLMHSGSPTVWLEECRIFYNHLRNRGYPVKAINSSFHKVN